MSKGPYILVIFSNLNIFKKLFLEKRAVGEKRDVGKKRSWKKKKQYKIIWQKNTKHSTWRTLYYKVKIIRELL